MQSPEQQKIQRQAQREAKWLNLWQTRNWVTCALWPVSWLFQRAAQWRKIAFSRSWRAQYRMPVPIVVVGGIMVGGVGKTPIVAQLVQDLKKAGFNPAIVARGYGSDADHHHQVVRVTSESLASEVGDEAVLLAQKTGVPVWVGAHRVDVARALCSDYSECDVIISDDGLQHYRLFRDIEIAVLDERGVGNGWCLPAGPLREGPKRLNTVSAVIFHQRNQTDASGAESMNTDMNWLPNPLTQPQFYVQSGLNHAYALSVLGRTIGLAQFASDLGQNVLMLAAIARPATFFDMLARFGIQGDTLGLPDHAPLDTAMADRLQVLLAEKKYSAILLTEKDAAKCRTWLKSHPQLAGKIWVVPLAVRQNADWHALSEHIVNELHQLNH